MTSNEPWSMALSWAARRDLGRQETTTKNTAAIPRESAPIESILMPRIETSACEIT